MAKLSGTESLARTPRRPRPHVAFVAPRLVSPGSRPPLLGRHKTGLTRLWSTANSVTKEARPYHGLQVAYRWQILSCCFERRGGWRLRNGYISTSPWLPPLQTQVLHSVFNLHPTRHHSLLSSPEDTFEAAKRILPNIILF